MKKISKFIVEKRYIFFGIFFALLILSFFSMRYTNINYDLSQYLSDDTETKQALQIMEDEFSSSSSAKIMIKNEEKETIIEIKTKLEEIEGILLVDYDEELNYKVDGSDSYALINIMLDTGDYDIESQKTVLKIKETLKDYHICMSGASVDSLNMETNISKEINIILLVSCLIILIVLLLTSHSWFEPVIFLMVIGVSILINMGTNLIFGSISYITQSVQAILQLALAMDYSIIMLHAYEEERQKQDNEKQAIISALKNSIVSIFSSALTTVAGLSALMFMSFTIGFDIGMVLSKGIICSMLTVFLIMPGLILLFRKPLLKLKHKPLPMTGKWIAKVVDKGKIIFVSILVVIIGTSFVLQTKNDYIFSYQTNNSESAQIKEQFGDSNQMVILLPLATTKEDYQKQIDLKQQLMQLTIDDKPFINSVTTMAEIDVLMTEIDANMLAEKLGIPNDEVLIIYQMIGLNPEGEFLYKFVIETYNYIDKMQHTPLDEKELLQMLHLENNMINSSMIKSILNNLNKDKATTLEVIKYIKESNIYSLLSEQQKKMIDKAYDVFYGDNQNILELINQFYLQVNPAVSQFNGSKHSRVIIDLSISGSEKENNKKAIEMIKEKANGLYENNNYLAGQNMVSYDIEKAFQEDLLKVNLITIIAIIIILLFAFKSLLLPFILVFVIQGAIYISMAISYIGNQPIFFMSYLICICIQMGATIDYGIILTSKYMESRKEKNKMDSIQDAIKSAIPTILTSGTILVVAGFVVGLISTELAISSIGLLLGRGTIISILMVLILLPSLLLLLDKPIMKTLFLQKKSEKKNCNSDLEKL